MLVLFFGVFEWGLTSWQALGFGDWGMGCAQHIGEKWKSLLVGISLDVEPGPHVIVISVLFCSGYFSVYCS